MREWPPSNYIGERPEANEERKRLMERGAIGLLDEYLIEADLFEAIDKLGSTSSSSDFISALRKAIWRAQK